MKTIKKKRVRERDTKSEQRERGESDKNTQKWRDPTCIL